MTELPERAAVDGIFHALSKEDALLEHKALQILTPNAPGFDRLAAIAIAEAWRARTGRPCTIVQFNAASEEFMDDSAAQAMAELSSGLASFKAQSDQLSDLRATGHRLLKMDLREPGQSDTDLAQSSALYENNIRQIQKDIMALADEMVFSRMAGEGSWTQAALEAWEQSERMGVLL